MGSATLTPVETWRYTFSLTEVESCLSIMMIKLTATATLLLSLSVFNSEAGSLYRTKRSPQFLPQLPPIELPEIGLPAGVPNIVGTLFPSPLEIGASVGEAAFNFANDFVNPCDVRFIDNFVSNAVQETGQGFFQGLVGGAIQNTFGGNPCGRR